ncbi:glycosyltransferase family 4 protein [Cellulomonas sp. NPDC055163]
MSTVSSPLGTRLVASVNLARGGQRRALRTRLDTLVATLSGEPAPEDARALLRLLEDLLADADRSSVWLALAVLRAELPLAADVVRVARDITLDGPLHALAPYLTPSRNPLHRGRGLREVEVVTGEVLVDLEHTSHTALATGIQRVARQAAVRWDRDHEIALVGWTWDDRSLRRLDADERRTGLHGASHVELRPGGDSRVLVPWRCTYLLPELATEAPRTQRLLALAEFSGSRTGVIGFDCVPLSSGETVGEGMGSAFAGIMAAVRHMDRVATISHAAAREYEGWRMMLAGVGLPGPQIAPVVLPVEAQRPSEAALDSARTRFLADALPLVLCVGSHEPRKNHLAVLHAAELAWRSGAQFNLVFVGGNSWNSDAFTRRLRELQDAGRTVESVSALSDDLLWAGYALARCVLFPSLNEGFGLPVAEAIATGTPVVTSRFGSMQEIAQHGGALLVDPRDEHELAEALVSLVTDDAVHAAVARAGASAPTRTWDEYAADLWAYLVEHRDPA